MLAMMAAAVPRLAVDRERGAALLAGAPLATDEVLRRAEAGEPFRAAYRAVAAALRRGARLPALPASAIAARRASTGGLGNLGLGRVRARLLVRRRWSRVARRRFEAALGRLAGTRPRGKAP
jgi:argininosuccinate lyase